MKQLRAFAFALIALMAIPAFSHAQVVTVTKTAEKLNPAKVLVQNTKTDDANDVALAEEVELISTKQTKVSEGLTTLIARLSTILTRTEGAVALVAKKDIDTTDAAIELQKAAEALQNAEKDLAIFNSIAVDDTLTGPKAALQAAQLKEAAKKTEMDLKDARNYLILTLASLKSSLTLAN